MVSREPYWTHLTNTMEWLEVGDMFNHGARYKHIYCI